MATVQQQQTTQLEFHQAMADFKTMFPSMDDDVIEAVLRSNQGAVDATIDQLLAMSTDNENEKIRLELEQVEDTVCSLPSVSPPQISVEQKSGVSSQSNRVGTPLHQQRGWAPPLLGPLPDDFLRLNPEPPATANKQIEGELEDERIALFLQNEEFMAELRWNKDFLLMLDKDSPPEERMSSFSNVRSADDDAIFKERLRNMGKMSRKKFSQLARVFTGRKKRSSSAAKAILQEEDSDGP